MLVQKRLQNQRRGDLIHHLLVRLAGVAGLVEQGMSLLRGKPLIPQVDRQVGERLKFGGEGFDLLRPWTHASGHVERQSDYDAGDSVAAAEPGNGAKRLAWAGARVAMQVEGQNRLGGESKLV